MYRIGWGNQLFDKLNLGSLVGILGAFADRQNSILMEFWRGTETEETFP